MGTGEVKFFEKIKFNKICPFKITLLGAGSDREWSVKSGRTDHIWSHEGYLSLFVINLFMSKEWTIAILLESTVPLFFQL